MLATGKQRIVMRALVARSTILSADSVSLVPQQKAGRPRASRISQQAVWLPPRNALLWFMHTAVYGSILALAISFCTWRSRLEGTGRIRLQCCRRTPRRGPRSSRRCPDARGFSTSAACNRLDPLAQFVPWCMVYQEAGRADGSFTRRPSAPTTTLSVWTIPSSALSRSGRTRASR